MTYLADIPPNAHDISVGVLASSHSRQLKFNIISLNSGYSYGYNRKNQKKMSGPLGAIIHSEKQIFTQMRTIDKNCLHLIISTLQ